MLPVELAEEKAVKRNAGSYTLVDGKLFRHGYTHPILTCVRGISVPASWQSSMKAFVEATWEVELSR